MYDVRLVRKLRGKFRGMCTSYGQRTAAVSRTTSLWRERCYTNANVSSNLRIGEKLWHTQYCSSLTRHYLFSFSPDVHPSATEEGLTCFGAEFFLITERGFSLL